MIKTTHLELSIPKLHSLNAVQLWGSVLIAIYYKKILPEYMHSYMDITVYLRSFLLLCSFIRITTVGFP